MHPQYPNLYSTIQIGSLILRNRIIASPSSQNDIEPNGTLGKHNIAYYARKAQGGAALVTVGDGIVHSTGKDHPVQVLLYNDDCLSSLTRCAEEIHKYGAFASYELSHGGIVCDPNRCTAITDVGVEAEDKDGNDILLPADNVIISVGMRPRTDQSEALRDCAPVFIPIGNCVRPGVVKDAIRAGFDAAMFQI